ncbi:MAG: cytidine deaminase [Bacillota bacterium]
MKKKTKEKMLKLAKEAIKNAYVPYSNFPLSAALLTKEGKIFTGVNIENASYGLTNCAERTAIFKAVSEGYRDFEALLLYGNQEKTITPCGACRQVINEFGDDIEIIMVNKNDKEVSKTSSELLPGAFKQEDMKDEF